MTASPVAPRGFAPLVLDLRSLALFRLLLGGLLAQNFLARLCNLGAFYTDAGLLPRALLLGSERLSGPTLALTGGGGIFIAVVLLAGALCALAFALGYRTRLNGLLAGVLLLSIQHRNPLVLTDADTLLVWLLLAGLLLPLNARWSADAALSTQPPPSEPRHRSLIGTLLLLGVLALPPLTLLLGPGLNAWPSASGFYPLATLPLPLTGLGQWVIEWAGLSQSLATYLSLIAWIAPLLALSPWRTDPFRLGSIALLASGQLLVLLTLEAGSLPWLGLASLSLLLGPQIWEALAPKASTAKPLRIYYDQDCGFCRKSCLLLRALLILPPDTRVEPAQASARPRALMEAQWSWVIIDAADEAHLKWPALVALIKASRWLGWSHRFFSLPLWQPIGNRVYDLVATHRGIIARLTSPWIRERAERYQPAGIWRLAGSALLIAALAGSVLAAIGQPIPTALSRPLAALGLQPLPLSAPASGPERWALIGRRDEDQLLDLFSNRPGAPHYDGPAPAARGPEPQRWQRYFHHLAHDPLATQWRVAWARWACREYGLTDVRLERIQVVASGKVERQSVWRQACASPRVPMLPEALAEPVAP